MQLISALRETSTESSRQIVESIRQIKSSNPSRGAELQGQFDKLQREPDKLTENETERLLKGIRDELKLIKDSAKPSTSTADDEQDPSKD